MFASSAVSFHRCLLDEMVEEIENREMEGGAQETLLYVHMHLGPLLGSVTTIDVNMKDAGTFTIDLKPRL